MKNDTELIIVSIVTASNLITNVIDKIKKPNIQKQKEKKLLGVISI